MLSKAPNKYFHVQRGLYTAQCLLNNILPDVKTIQEFKQTKETNSIHYFQNALKDLREILNHQHEKGIIKQYFIPHVKDPLLLKLYNSNNVREFKY